jgi:hypothetical protein
VLPLICATAYAQSTSNAAASTSGIGNQQSINFITPGESNAVLDSRYSGSYTVKNVPSVSGPNLTTSNDTCMGSSSGGVAGPGFGVSLGSTWTDEQCKRLKMSRELWNKGMKAASLAMDCMDPAAKTALELTGTKCPQSMTQQERVAAFGPDAAGADPVRGAAASNVAPASDQVAGASSVNVSKAADFRSLYPD